MSTSSDPIGNLLSTGRSLLGRLHLGQLLRARATLPGLRDRPFLIWGERSYSYAETYQEALRYAALFRRTRNALVARGELAREAPLSVGLYRENAPSFVFAVLGAALERVVVVALNTGFRGDTLAALLDRAEVRLLLADQERLEQLEPVLDGRPTLGPERVLVDAASHARFPRLDDALREPATAPGTRPRGEQPLLVIYTSGTTGVPKGIGCSHIKLSGAGLFVSYRIGLRPSDRGYVCMPLFHSNAWYLGIMPLFVLGGSFVLKPRFSASAFEDDVLAHGVTYMSYVGQPLHYIVEKLERKYGGGDAVREALARHPRNRFRLAHGNGALGTDRAKLADYLGMEHIYELYGSTEAVINTVVKPGDPLDSVGRIRAKNIVVLDEHGRECPPAEVDERGRILNYEAAVGEICARMKRQSLLFEGYFGDDAATRGKYRDGHYHSGDLGHVRVIDGQRYLYFDGRTDDWIRKDGENFSAESVARFVCDEPGVALAVAYGVPAPVSDELVAVALELRDGARFDPAALTERLLGHQREGGMDPKWMPDFVRVVEQLPRTTTDKVLVRVLKRESVDLARNPDMKLYRRRRGDVTFQPFTHADYEAFRDELAGNGRAHLLGGG